MWEEELSVAKKLAIEAGKEILKIYNDKHAVEVEFKSDCSPITRADKASNSIIESGLKRYYPSYAVLSEEGKNDSARLMNNYCFVVDPLDGTKEFIKKNGQFTVNIALSVNHKTEMGVIYAPVLDELYYASKNDGAFLLTDASKSDASMIGKRISVSSEHNRLRCIQSASHNCKEMEELIKKAGITDLVSMGSSLKGCIIARGDADIYYRFNPTMEWDTAAMQCIIEEAGGIFRQLDGNEMLYNRENPCNERGFYAVNCKRNIIC